MDIIDINDETLAGYYTSIADMRQAYAGGKFNLDKINVFAAILSHTMPKSNSPNASHKYSVNFVIIDPTAEMHSESIYFMWFCNTLENLHMKFRVGDIIRIENANMQVFNGHPQLVAKEHSAAVTIFQRREVLNSGRPIYPIDTPDKFASEIEAEQEGGVNNESQVAAAQSRRPYSDPAWNTTVLGVADLANIKLTKKLKKDLPKPDPNRPPKMWVDEVAKLLDLHTWATRRFAHHCYSDPSYHSTLHALQSYLYRCINSLDYANLSPTAEALPQDANLFAANQNRLCSGKCDVVCLVMCIHPPASSVDGLARMTVWDGTTNGVYAPNPIFGGEIRRAMQAPSLYDVFHASVITRDAATAAAAAAPATTTTTALPVAGSAGASSNSSSSAPPPAQPPGTEEDTSLPPVFPLGAKLTELENCTQATPPRLHGCGVKITAADISTNQHIMRCKAGMWVRIRNVYGTAQPVFGATLRADSHVCQLSPSCLDVRIIMRCYTQRMVRRFMHEMPPPSLPLRSGQPFSATAHTNANTNANTNAATSASASGNSNNGNGSAAGATGSKVGSGSAAAPLPPPIRKPQVFSGEPVTPLALVKAGPAPAKFCVHGKIQSWWPHNIQEFVTVENRAGGMVASHMQFALQVADNTESAQILFHDAEAERFLGVTCAELLTNANKRTEILHKLTACKDQGVVSEYKVKVFVFKESVNLPVSTSASNKKSTLSAAAAARRGQVNNQQENSYIRKTKRIIAFDTDCGVPDELVVT